MWQSAADLYAQALVIDPGMAVIHIQHGNMLKEAGQHQQAVIAYNRAIALAPGNGEGWLQLGHVLKLMGRAPDAVEAYRSAIVGDPNLTAAAIELAALGAADRIPPLLRANLEGFATRLQQLTSQVAALQRDLSPYTQSAFSYERFRALNPVAAPPGKSTARFTILIEVDTRAAAGLRATLASLREQSVSDWTAWCIGDAGLAEHPVASLSYQDNRIRCTVAAPDRLDSDLTLLLAPGTVLDRHALAWFTFVHGRTNCAASYADHDHAHESALGPRNPMRPLLQPAFDPAWFGSGLSTPALVCLRSDRAAAINRFPPTQEECLCALAGSGGAIVHIPRILSTILDVTAEARNAPPAPEGKPGAVASKASTQTPASATPSTATITVLIPTRDEADMLATSIATLLDKARDPKRLDILILDNRSSEARTAEILTNLHDRFGARVLLFDEPFNWSRVNNVGGHACTSDLLLFLNNDTEMQTEAWDDRIAADLGEDGIGLLGARLLYPDFTLQHGGIIFGMGEGSPRHEGVGSLPNDGGPDGRWVRRRSLGAVTGAAMAMRRSVWAEVGGFDEELAVGYNDVDMCLRVRDRGYRVLYAPDLCLIHHESKTRGMNVNRAQVAWDRAELRTLHRKWGDRLFWDPAMNLQWSRRSTEFSGYEEPTLAAILADMDQQIMPLRAELVNSQQPPSPSPPGTRAD